MDFRLLLDLNDIDLDLALTLYTPPNDVAFNMTDNAFSVIDSDGNSLIHGRVRIDTNQVWTSTELLRWNTALERSIPNTGLRLCFRFPVTAPVAMSADMQTAWQNFWLAWVKTNRPLPTKSLPKLLPWFHKRAAASPDLHDDLSRQIRCATYTLSMTITMTLTFIIYGGLHLLAWQYNFNSEPERYLWRISAVVTASSGLMLITLRLAGIIDELRFNLCYKGPGWKELSRNDEAKSRFYKYVATGIKWLSCLMAVLNAASRAFLVVESFIALPNSPLSTYTTPSRTSYIPHI